MQQFKTYFKATRPMFFTAVILPVLLGAAYARHAAGLNRDSSVWLLVLTLIAGVLYHAGMNVINDYFDYLGGTDNINDDRLTPFTGGSRMIQDGLMTPAGTLLLSLLLLAAGTAIGLYLVYLTGWGLLLIGAVGLFTGFFYSAPPLRLVGRGLGEATVGLNFGILTVIGSYYVQTGRFSLAAALISLPIGFLIAGLLYVNGFPDLEADRATGKVTLVVRLGAKTGARVLPLIFACSYVSLFVAVAAGFVPRLAYIAFLSLPFALMACVGVIRNYDKPALMLAPIKMTVLAHFLTGVLLVVSLVV